MCVYTQVWIYFLCIYNIYHASKRKYEPQLLFKVRVISLRILIINILDFSDPTGKLNM